ncbi:MAG TPA: type II toxin-antitoxin system RelE/ParE family toxin [Rhizobiaceae bacterium]|nr:type II toxin-antitoxin system RelE/ParE family toxin [Rhizobiaceae bacterium]
MVLIRRSARAEEDLIQIWSYLAQQNPRAADQLLDRLQQRWELLATQPRSGVARDDIGSGIRYVATGEYITFYRPGSDGLEIMRVIHGRRDIKADDFET